MKRQFKSFDYLLLFCVCLLSIIGIILIGSATHIKINGTSSEFTSQQVWFLLGIIFMLVASFVDYHFISKFYIFLYAICLLLLVGGLIYGKIFTPHIPVRRWIYFGPFGIQPSEFAKIFMIIFVAKFIDKYIESFNNLPVLSVLIVIVSIPFILIMMQPSLSASLVIVFIAISIMFVGNLNSKYIYIFLLLFVPSLFLFFVDITKPEPLIIDKILTDYQMVRILTMLSPDANSDSYYQVNQSIHALGSGQLNGKGLHNGLITQYSNLPAAHNDFIFSVLGEEFGFIGCVAVLALTLFIIIKCIIVAQKSADMLGKLIASGVAAMFTFQAFVNVAVVTGLFPNTGMPYPFLSYGGSSMFACMIAVGLVINVGMTKTKSIFEG